MRLVTPPLVVEENDAFKNDALDRKSYGEALLNLVIRSNDELVISLDGNWGEGKTTFVKMWQGLLSENDVSSIYIDAFSNDYVDDAFISVASAITNYAEARIKKDQYDKITELKEKTKKIGGQLLSWSARVGIKAATLGVIKDAELEELKGIKGDMAKGVSDLVGNFVEERINSHSKDIELIQSFKELLSSIPSKLKENGEKPLVIIIDELDRCKPTFSVEIIEKIKHLFSVKNVVFVLVMNKVQLEESIRCVYGQNIDAHTYLQKFVNLETKIPKRMEDRYINDLRRYSDRLLQLHEIETWGDVGNIIDCLAPLATHFNLSLRQLEKVFTNLAVFYGSSGENHWRPIPILIYLIVVKVIDPQLFDQLLHQRASFSEVTSHFKMIGLSEENEDKRKLNWIMNWIRFGLLSEEEFNKLPEDDVIKKYPESLWPYNISREVLLPFFAQKISMFKVN